MRSGWWCRSPTLTFFSWQRPDLDRYRVQKSLLFIKALKQEKRTEAAIPVSAKMMKDSQELAGWTRAAYGRRSLRFDVNGVIRKVYESQELKERE
jgi:hypothetical protein